MFTSLEGSQSPLERWMLPRRHTNATKAHPILPLRQHHEGVSQPLVVDLEAASKPSQTFRGTNHKLIPHRSTPTAQESPTSKSNKIKGEMLKTCSNHELLWSQEGEGEDLSFDWNNSQEHSLISPGSKIWCRRSEREPLVFLGRFGMKCSTLPRSGRGIFIPPKKIEPFPAVVDLPG